MHVAEHALGKREVLVALPLDAALRQHVVVPAHAQADGPVLPVVDLSVRHGEEVEVDDVVERAHRAFGDVRQLLRIVDVDVAERQAGQVAHDERARLRHGDHNLLAVDVLDALPHLLDGAHVLRDLGAQVAAVDDALVLVRVRPVHRVAVERERRARFHRTLDDETDDVLDGDDALLDARIGHAFEVLLRPLLAETVLERVAFHRGDFVRAHEVPVALDVVARLLPEVIGVADGGEHVVRLHAVVAVVRAQREEFGQVAMPRVQVHRHGALPHAQLVDRHGRVVRQANPTDDAAGRPVEPADGAARRAHLAEVQAHAAAVLAHLREVVDAAVDAVQAVGHRVDEARRQLMERLARVRQRGRGHGHLERGQHVVEAAHPSQALGRVLLHGEVQRDAEEHLLRRLERRALVRADDVAVEQQLQTRIGEQVVAGGVEEGGGLAQLGGRVVLQDVVAVEALFGEEGHLLRERLDMAGGHALVEGAVELHHEQARGDDLPARCLLGGQLDGRLDEHGQLLVVGGVGFRERLELVVQVRELVFLAGELLLHGGQHARQRGDAGQLRAQALAGGALAGAVLAVQDVAFELLVVVRLHERALDEVLHVLDRDGAAVLRRRFGHRALDAGDQAIGFVVGQVRAHAGECGAHGAFDLVGDVRLRRPVAFGNLHVGSRPSSFGCGALCRWSS